ncbi:HAD family hydrolase [Candidatus Aciduliprofundum boonei]|uniref:HAD-superfamily hydrolase, subfamily IA, variant 1 n=1 Tax=Aciduliprofundum boonei (strain DSM 19572 / T469) TaxID=439481 RepID=B5IDK5_ACIB4|nr:HAD family hydrolase [Candidatus Aciduliprofundum boonei]ADD08079.1 HAD-superfamily hydrolase, subfamily IA, variant 1 [Aciduliprofundum boonei T469]EDY35437.1 haloacid dehalogenase-like hydrolase, putative [Aciduliprofundum boonei T469]EDY35550.1 haloacid dehalogenase-like hydrolase, putative [Aciduliprofundum boonei T469]HII54501.1 HAD family hydrolase [Candidatus Aciduliprofundum boonei]
MAIKLVIFDLDDTIVENTIPFSEMRERILNEMGIEDAPKHLYEFLKARGEEYLKLLEREEIKRAKKARIASSLPSVLEFLKERGIKKAVLTRNSKKATIIALGDYVKEFDAIITREDEFEPKPSDEAVNYLLKKFNVSKDECIVVGDYDYDIIAGKRAGCITVGVRMGKGDYRIEDIRELVELISMLENDIR